MNVTRRNFLKRSLWMGGALILPKQFVHAAVEKTKKWLPAYAILEKEGKLAPTVERAYSIFEECRLCPRQCGVNRLKGEKGFCRATSKLFVYSTHPHFGEEVSLVGKNGSGTIFFFQLQSALCFLPELAHRP